MHACRASLTVRESCVYLNYETLVCSFVWCYTASHCLFPLWHVDFCFPLLWMFEISMICQLHIFVEVVPPLISYICTISKFILVDFFVLYIIVHEQKCDSCFKKKSCHVTKELFLYKVYCVSINLPELFPLSHFFPMELLHLFFCRRLI